MMITKMSELPWDSIPAPACNGIYVVRLVEPNINPTQKRVFWAKGAHQKPALLVEYDPIAGCGGPLPTFKNIKVFNDCDRNQLLIELLEVDMKDNFYDLCLDVVEALQGVSFNAAGKISIMRLERWAVLLRPGRVKLTLEEQKGLIAELDFLEHDALNIYGSTSALDGWCGPEKAKRDFAYGQTFIEVKSKRGSSNTTIRISSEEQLNLNPSERLFLYVEEINCSGEGDANAFTLAHVVSRVESLLESPMQIARFQTKLAEIGYLQEDSYDTAYWTRGLTEAYEIRDGFPRIDSSSCNPGVSSVCYNLDLAYCADYEVDLAVITNALR